MGSLINHHGRPTGSKCISGLLPGLIKQEFPVGETLKSGQTFISKFEAAGGEFPATDFRPLGWVHAQEKA